MNKIEGTNIDVEKNDLPENAEGIPDAEKQAKLEKKLVLTETTKEKTAAKLDVAASQVEQGRKTPEAPKKDATMLEQAQTMFEDAKKYVTGETKNEAQPAGVESAPDKKGLWEGTKKILNDIKEDFQKSSPAVKAGYVLGAVVGFLAARWMWREAFGTDQKEGFVKKVAKWLASIVAAGAGMVGIMKLRETIGSTAAGRMLGWGKKPSGTPQRSGSSNPNREEKENERSTIGKNFNTAFGVLSPDQFKTEAEYQSALEQYLKNNNITLPSNAEGKEAYRDALEKSYLETLQKNGGMLTMFQGSLYFIAKNGMSTVVRSGTLFNSAAKLLYNRDLESGCAFAMVWIGGIPLYACGFGAIDFVRLAATVGPKAGFARAATNSVLWPVEILMKTGRTAGLLTETGRFKLAKQFKVIGQNIYHHPKYLSKVYKLSLVRREIEIRCIENFRAWRVNRDLARDVGLLKMKAERYGIRQVDALERLAADLKILAKDGQIPAFIENAPGARNIMAQIKNGAIDIENLEKVLIGASEAENAVQATVVATEATEAATGSKAAKTGEAVAGEKIAVEVAEDNAKTVGKLEKVIRTNPKLAALLEKMKVSPKAFLKILRNAKALKLAGKAVPYVGAGIQWWIYTFIDEPEWEAKLEKETDPLKKKVIENEMFSARMNWKLDALGAPGALSIPGLTLLIGNLGRQYGNESIVEGTKYMLQDRKDLMGKTDGEILAEAEKSAPNSMVSYGQRIASIGESKAFNAANTSTRGEAFAAYFEQRVMLPPVTEDLLGPNESRDPANVERRLAILNQDQVKYFTQSALSYIAHATNNTFASVTADMLQKAEAYGKHAWMDWVKERTGQPATFTKLGWPEKENMITQSLRKENADRIAELNERMRAGSISREEISFSILESMQSDLALSEAKILTTDFSDWTVLNWTNETEMKQIARGEYKEKIMKELQAIVSNTMPVTEQSLEACKTSIKKILSLDANTLAIEGLKSPRRATLSETGKIPLGIMMLAA